MQISRFFVILLALSAVGCHSYQPIALEEIRPSMTVRARLSAERADEIARVHPISGRVLDGVVRAAGPEELQILVPLRQPSGVRSERSVQLPLGIPNQDILLVELKKLDRTKTGLFALGGAALLGLVLSTDWLGDGGGGDDPGKPGGDPQDAIIPFRISIPWG
ncbi:MAG: hypothetical protein HKO65_02315 [Gemmatimonadetes bacterium]|nr:hypothetical protein [Gemmatimonadota bacterium]NNM03911.1 hypothetical protein [Gemmatimonadota bacterium]